jgi:hypothetical protein
MGMGLVLLWVCHLHASHAFHDKKYLGCNVGCGACNAHLHHQVVSRSTVGMAMGGAISLENGMVWCVHNIWEVPLTMQAKPALKHCMVQFGPMPNMASCDILHAKLHQSATKWCWQEVKPTPWASHSLCTMYLGGACVKAFMVPPTFLLYAKLCHAKHGQLCFFA